jgi:hypothetical protein
VVFCSRWISGPMPPAAACESVVYASHRKASTVLWSDCRDSCQIQCYTLCGLNLCYLCSDWDACDPIITANWCANGGICYVDGDQNGDGYVGFLDVLCTWCVRVAVPLSHLLWLASLHLGWADNPGVAANQSLGHRCCVVPLAGRGRDVNRCTFRTHIDLSWIITPSERCRVNKLVM